MHLGVIFSYHSSQITHNGLFPPFVMQGRQKAASWEKLASQEESLSLVLIIPVAW